MRIIGGKYKHKRFNVPGTFKARPTTDFAKESLFNILDNVYIDFESRPTALDLFGGTGSIGLEFVSRGCRKVVSVEKDFRHYQFLKQVARELNDSAWLPLHADVFKFIQKTSEPYDIIFADPPYQLENLGDIPRLVFEHNLLAEDGLFILEHGKNYHFEDDPHFTEHRNYGSVNFTFFEHHPHQEPTHSENK